MKRLLSSSTGQNGFAQRPGSILLLLLIVVSIGFVVALSLIQVSLTQQQTVRYEDFSLRAYYAAEAGVEDAIPRIMEAASLSGKALDDYLTDPDFEVTMSEPLVLSTQQGEDYQFTRHVSRTEPVETIARTLEAEQAHEFDLSDVGDVSLEEQDLRLQWIDEDCDEPAGCSAAVEAVLYSKISRTTNYLFNPSFELGSLGAGVADTWEAMNDSTGGHQVVAPAADEAKAGARVQQVSMTTAEYDASLEIENNQETNLGGTGVAGITRPPGNRIPVKELTTYTLSAYIKAEDSLTGTVAINFGEYDHLGNIVGDRNVLDRKFQFGRTEGAWRRIYIQFETSAKASELVDDHTIQPYIYLQHPGTGEFWIDAVQMEEGDLTAYCDGDQVYGEFGECTWEGTAHMSTSLRDNIYMVEHFFYDPREGGVDSGFANEHLSGDQITQFVEVEYPSDTRILRLKSMFDRVHMEISAVVRDLPSTLVDLPGQEIEIRSVGQFADTQRAITLRRGLPTILPQFDYVLYNHGCADGEDCISRDLVK